MFKLTKATRALLLLGVLLSSVYVQAHGPEGYPCTHNQEDDSNVEYIDVEEEGYDKEAGQATQDRILASTTTTYPQMRMYGYYGFIDASATYVDYLSNELLPPILSYFESALQVKYPVSGAFKVTSSSVCNNKTPTILKTGVNADFIYVFAAMAGSGTWVASTSICSAASGTHRPLIGGTVINTNLFRVAGTDVLLHESNMLAIMHELTHALGFTTAAYGGYLNANGQTLSNVLLSGSLDGVSTKILNVEPLTSYVQSYFNCPSAIGMYLENQGSYGAVAGVHPERRHYAFEYMNAYLIGEMKVTNLTLNLLAGTGWYVPDYSYADATQFGYQEGCAFLTGSAATVQKEFTQDFCDVSTRKCASPSRGGGTCSSDVTSDGTAFVHPSDSYDCTNPAAASYARLPSLQTFGRNTTSKCFEGTLGGSSGTTYCFVSSCSYSGSTPILNLEVGGKTVACTSAGSVTVAGYSGSITCPDPKKWCPTIGLQICPRNCMGRGECVNGYCQCYSGFDGEDCALNA